MPKLPGIPHLQAVRALEKAGFTIVASGQAHRDDRWPEDPHYPSRHPINAYTMGGIVRGAGLTVDEFRALL